MVLRILSLEFNDCSEETRPMGRRILFGLVGPLGGCGVFPFIKSFGDGSGVSQSETINQTILIILSFLILTYPQ